jgi:hypothetical protein
MDNLPPLERYSFGNLGKLTTEADEYLNSARRAREAKRRSKEVIEKLNTNIQQLYLHQAVSVFGIHKKMGLDKVGNMHVYLKRGELEGISDGFIVVDFQSDFEDVHADKYRNQGDLLANLHEFAPGRYAVAHLVKLFTLEGHSDDFLIQQNIIARGFSPAFASEIFPEEQAEVLDDFEVDESERIRSIDVGLASRQMGFIEQQIHETGDPLNVLIRHSRKFRGLKPSEQYSFCRTVNSNILGEITGRRYRFNDGLPLFFMRMDDGSGSGPNQTQAACEVLILGLDQGPHYEIDWDGDNGSTTEESALYLTGYLIDEGRLGTQPLVIPLESLRGHDIILQEDSDSDGQTLYNCSDE